MALPVPNTALGGSALEGAGRKAAESPTLGWGQAGLVHYNNSWEGGVVNVLLFSSFPFAPSPSSFPLLCWWCQDRDAPVGSGQGFVQQLYES